MQDHASDLARRLARQAEAVCRHYLSNGRREGRYWLVGNVENSHGRSLYVRLTGADSGKGAAGKWTDAATGAHGDLLDLIAANRRLDSLRNVLDEARSFLLMPRSEPPQRELPAPTGSLEAARRLFAIAKPIAGTLSEAYLSARGITGMRSLSVLRHHPNCYYRSGNDEPVTTPDAWPALIASVTDLTGALTGVHRTWLDLSGREKALVATPRRAMGHLLGNGVRFGVATDIMAAGEGIETMLSLRCIMPDMPMIAALSANHLAALELPATLCRLYVAREDDPAGRHATETLADRASKLGIETLPLDAALSDFNEDLRRIGRDDLASGVRVQLAPEDVERFCVTVSTNRKAA